MSPGGPVSPVDPVNPVDPVGPVGTTSIVIVDDHPIVRQGLRSLLSNRAGFTVVGEAATVQEGLQLIRARRPDVSLVDIRLGGGSGLDLIDRVLEEDPAARVLVVSSFDDDEYVTRSLRAGALGYVLKADSPSVLVTAIETVASGQRALSPAVTGHLVAQLMGEAESPEPDLDQLELRMLQLVARGRSNGQIADELFMSDTTVKRRLRVLFGKLGVARRAEAVAAAARRGLL
jgi:DNA-binding NarL/FixJ family response regulator